MLALISIAFLCLLTAASFPNALAWTTGSAVSSFGGSVLVVQQRQQQRIHQSSSSRRVGDITMKKGKDNVPPSMRAQYTRQKEMVAMREQMLANSKPGSDGLPVFNLFVRTKRANVWYPCGSFKGDDRSAALAKNYADGGLLAGVSKNQIDSGIAGSLFRDQEKLKETICRAYPQLRKSRSEFEFGYKLAYEGLSKEKADEITVIEPKEPKGLLDNVKSLFGR